MSPFTSVSDFKYVTGDLDQIDLSVDIMPNRSDYDRRCIYGKDIAVLMEMIAERWRAVGFTNKSFTFSKQLVKSTVSGLIDEIFELTTHTGESPKFIKSVPTDYIGSTERDFATHCSSVTVKESDLPFFQMALNRLQRRPVGLMFDALKLLNTTFFTSDAVRPTWHPVATVDTKTYTPYDGGDPWTENYHYPDQSPVLTDYDRYYWHARQTKLSGGYAYTTGEYLASSAGNATFPFSRNAYQNSTEALSSVIEFDTTYTTESLSAYQMAYAFLASSASTQSAMVAAMRDQFLSFNNLEAHTADDTWFEYYGVDQTFHPYGNISSHTYADYPIIYDV